MPSDRRAARLGVLAAVAVILFSALGVRLWFLQAVEATDLQQQVDETNRREVLIAPERGQIFDTKGRLLAGNELVLNVAVDWAAIRDDSDRAALFRRLSGWVDVPVEVMEERYDARLYSRLRPLPIAEDVPEHIVTAIRERSEDFPGVTYTQTYRRVYPYAPLAAHLIGYMGAITEEDEGYYLAKGYDTSIRGEDVGRAGVELSYEEVLHGRWGKIVYEVDPHGRIVREISRVEPVNGRDIQLSIDLELQQYAERLLQTQLRLRRAFKAPNPVVDKPDGSRQRMSLNHGPDVHYKAPAGSVVVMNYQTGAVMAMASYPTFDNRWFTADITGSQFDELFNPRRESDDCGHEGQDECPVDNDRAALINRAIQGRYNLGSTFKPFVAYAGMMNGVIGPGDWINDEGTYKATGIEEDLCAQGVKCVWRNSWCADLNRPCDYGSINTYWSLAVSSDVFYYRLGELMFTIPGSEDRMALQNQVAKFGFGSDTGIDLPYEYDGALPSHELKAELHDAGVLHPSEEPRLLLGDVINLAIGQGLLAATPIQVAVGYSAFANDAYVMVPRVVEAVYEPNTPAGTVPGYVDLDAAVEVERFVPEGTEIELPEEYRQAIVGGIRQNVTGPGTNGRSTTAEELFDVGYPDSAISVAGKTGTAQGQYNYPWNDSSVFAAFSTDTSQPYTVVAYLEKSGFGSTGAAPVVKCTFLALGGETPLDPVALSEPLDPESDVVAQPYAPVDTTCMNSSNANTVYPGSGPTTRPED